MKKLFSWRFPLSEAEFSSLWESATFVFDTNFLLDLYRVSRSTSEDFLQILERLQDRIWLPYQVAEEFLNGREAVIEKEAASLQETDTKPTFIQQDDSSMTDELQLETEQPTIRRKKRSSPKPLRERNRRNNSNSKE